MFIVNLQGTGVSRSNKNSVGSDRLRKAIERNRRKQGKKPTRPAKDMASLAERTVKSSKKGTRLSVGRPGESEFLGKRSRPAPTSKLSYSVKRPKSRAKPGKKFVLNDRVAIVLWLFVGFLTCRLLFADRGVIDYYSKRSTLQERELNSLEVEENNGLLIKEIAKIKTESSYQKKIIREHLGFIAENEFLILFGEEKKSQSI